VVVSKTGYSKDALGDPVVRPVALVEKPFDEQTLLDVLRRHLPD